MEVKMKKIVALLLALVMVFGLAACGTPSNNTPANNGSAPAAQWPGKQKITILVPQTVDSQVGLSTQILVDWLNEYWKDQGTTVVMECDAAAAGAATVEKLYNEGADGTYFLSGGAAQILSWEGYGSGTWKYNVSDTDKFIGVCAAIGQKTNSGGVFLTKKDSPFNTIAEFVQYVKDVKDGKIAGKEEVNVGYANGTPHELRLKLITEFYGISALINWTPLKNSDIITAAQNGQVDLACITEVQGAAQVKGNDALLKGIFNSRMDRDYPSDLEPLKDLQIATDLTDPSTGNTVTNEVADSLTLAWPMIIFAHAKVDREKLQIFNDACAAMRGSKEFMERVYKRGSTNDYEVWSIDDINKVIQDANKDIKAIMDKFNESMKAAK